MYEVAPGQAISVAGMFHRLLKILLPTSWVSKLFWVQVNILDCYPWLEEVRRQLSTSLRAWFGGKSVL
jgi:hypothetical protein